MKKLFLFSLAIFTTISLMTSCGEKGTGNATEDATKDATVVVDSTANATEVVKDTTVVK
jgi:predicted small lipoprotein YifL